MYFLSGEPMHDLSGVDSLLFRRPFPDPIAKISNRFARN